jgi:hypothetical protein
LKNVLGDAHEFVKCLLIEFLGETAYDLLCLIAVDGHSKTKLHDNHQALEINKRCLIDGSNASLSYIILHGHQLTLQFVQSLEYKSALSLRIILFKAMETFIELYEASKYFIEVFVCLVAIIFII